MLKDLQEKTLCKDVKRAERTNQPLPQPQVSKAAERIKLLLFVTTIETVPSVSTMFSIMRNHESSSSSSSSPSPSPSPSPSSSSNEKSENEIAITLDNDTIQHRQNYEGAHKISLDSTITSISGRTFYRCQNLHTIHFFNNNHDDGDDSNSNNSNNSSTSTSTSTSTGISKIGIWSFYASSSLRSITIPPSVTSIGKGAFRDCTSLSQVTLPPSLKSLGDVCFSNCSSLRHISLPKSLTSIGVSTFSYCESLVCVHILPNSVVDVEKRVFWGCRNLLLIYLPRTVVYVRENTFDDDCEVLEKRTAGGKNDSSNSNNNYIVRKNSNELNENENSNGSSRNKGGRNKYLNYHFDIVTWLRQRFDGLPVHRACYEYSSTSTLDILSNFIKEHKSTLCATDALGMTALHVLACNPNVNEEMIRLVRGASLKSSLKSSSNSSRSSPIDDDCDDDDDGDGYYYTPQSPLKLFLMCRNYLNVPIPPSPSSIPQSHNESRSNTKISLFDLLQKGIKCNELACALALDNGNDNDNDNKSNNDIACKSSNDENDDSGCCRVDLDLCRADEGSGLLPFMLAAASALPNCGLEMVYMLAMKNPNLLNC